MTKLEKLRDELAPDFSDGPHLELNKHSLNCWQVGFDASTEHWRKVVEVYDNALNNIDDHIRLMRVRGKIDMDEMILALKVLSDSLKPIAEFSKQIGSGK